MIDRLLSRIPTPILVLVALAFLGFIVLASVPPPARGHDWYPMECCSGMDCAPVDHMEHVAAALFDSEGKALNDPLPMTLVTITVAGQQRSGVVPRNFPLRESKDGRAHACINGGKLVCLFIPAGQ